MAINLSEFLSVIIPSATEKTSALVNQMRRNGIDIISFAQGEPDFETPDNIAHAGCKAIERGFTKYTDVGGIPELKAAIAKKILIENEISYKNEEIMVSNGGKQALYLLFHCICNPGDEVILPTPCYVSYADQVRLAGGVPIFVPMSEENGFAIQGYKLAPFINKRTKIIVLNSPNNPTGSVCVEKSL